MKLLLPFIAFLCFAFHSYSQSDLLVLKQHNRTIQTWIPGSMLHFQFSSGQWLDGIIRSIRNDSILIEQIRLEQVANRFGFATIDTARFGLMKFHVSEIYGMPKNDNAGIFTNGALLKVGSIGYILLNAANTLIHHEQLFSAVNATRLGVAGAVLITGILLGLNHESYIRIGRKYRMETLHI